MNPQENMGNPNKDCGIDAKIQSTPLRDDAEISKVLEEFMSETDSQAGQSVDYPFDAFLTKKINDRLRRKLREKRTSPIILATPSAIGPNSSASRKAYMLLPLEDSKIPDDEVSLLPLSGVSSESDRCCLLEDSDVLYDEYDIDNADEIDGDDAKDGKTHKRSASPEKPSCEGARKKNCVNIEIEENQEKDEMKKKLMRLEIKNRELDIKKKEARIYYYKLKSLRLEAQLGIEPSAIPLTKRRDK